MIGGI